MSQLSTQQATDLAKSFMICREAIQNFQIRHWDQLSMPQKLFLNRQQQDILLFEQDLLSNSLLLVVEDKDETLKRVEKIADNVRAVLGNTNQINQAEEVASLVVLLTAAVRSQHKAAIEDALKNLQHVLEE
jgi:hypothetical protein